MLKTLRIIESFYVAKNKFNLDGSNYDLIFLIPSESSGDERYSWILSAKRFDSEPEIKVVNEIFEFIKKKLTIDEYSRVARINIINTNNPMIKNIKLTVPRVSQDIVRMNGITIGDTDMHDWVIIRSKVLSGLKKGNAITITLTNDKIINAEIISIDESFKIKYYTAKGLRAFSDSNSLVNTESRDEQFLIDNDYIGFTNLLDIRDVN